MSRHSVRRARARTERRLQRRLQDGWRNLAVAATIALVPATVVTAQGVIAQAQTPTGGVVESRAIGQQLYDQHCASCHGLQGQGQADGVSLDGTKVTIPPLRGVGRAAVDFYISTGRMPAQEIHVYAIRQEASKFTPEQTAAIVDYVASFAPGGPDIPTLDLASADMQLGRRLFIQNCAACHGAVGQGGALTGNGGAYAPNLVTPTPLQIAEAVRFGPGPMPVFDTSIFDQHQLNSLVAYVHSFKRTPNPGGNSMGYGGPVIEGIVAWLLGLGVLILLIRQSGSKRGIRNEEIADDEVAELDAEAASDDDADDADRPVAAGAAADHEGDA